MIVISSKSTDVGKRVSVRHTVSSTCRATGRERSEYMETLLEAARERDITRRRLAELLEGAQRIEADSTRHSSLALSGTPGSNRQI